MYVRAMSTHWIRATLIVERIGGVLDGHSAPVKQSGKAALSIGMREDQVQWPREMNDAAPLTLVRQFIDIVFPALCTYGCGDGAILVEAR
jgi:hypothetical protein